MTTSITRLCLALLLVSSSWTQLHAQTWDHTQVVTVSPFGWRTGLFGVEWQSCATMENGRVDCSLRLGARVTSARVRTRPQIRDVAARTVRYTDIDTIIRMGSRQEAAGWTFGLLTGVTFVEDSLRPGLGLDVDRHWLIGRHLNIGAGAAVKGVVGMRDDIPLDYNTALRLSLGLVF
jgi:hypothetical protein